MKDGGSNNRNYTKQLNSSQFAPSSDDPCDDISFQIVLQNTQPALSNHSVSDILKVTTNEYDVVIATSDHGVCGTINAPQVLQLKKCLQKGKKFKAVIFELDIDKCKVRVRSSI
jgi:F0F1-type ATP synthase gamma subunit